MKLIYERESARLREQFQTSLDGRALLRGRSETLDSLIRDLWAKYVAPVNVTDQALAAVAIGGYGRRTLFPYSDIDILFLCEKQVPEQPVRDRIRALTQELWDARIKVSPTTKTLADCAKLQPDNVEGTISLLDCRFLAGNEGLFHQLRNEVLPVLVQRESQVLLQRLIDINNERRAKYSNTIFHLEPNLKDGVGGLRDYNLACWLALISHMSKDQTWLDAEQMLPQALQEGSRAAFAFLSDTRCFLHYRAGRDDNTLSWEAQEEAAARHIGVNGTGDGNPAAWMREYFRHARNISRLTAQVVQEVSAQRSSLYRQFQNWRSRVSNADFAVVNGYVYLKQPSAASDPDLLLRMFEFVAQHGTPLSSAAEGRVTQAIQELGASKASLDWWRYLAPILIRPYAGEALRSMQRLGLLTLIIPEFHLIDALVLRDLYHQYTVDEHTFLTLDVLHQLRQGQTKWEEQFARLLEELEEPELLFLSLLMHDLGKGVPSNNHCIASLEIAEKRLPGLGLSGKDIETVCFLIRSHLDMSAAMRRDFFDPQTVRELAHRIQAPERLKMLALLTLADIRAVSKEALTPWKAENLWQLYIVTSNFMSHSIDEERFHAGKEDEQLARIRLLAPQLGKRLKRFLEGMPRRYLSLHSAEEIAAHVEMASKISGKAVQLSLRRQGQIFELTLVTNDRPRIFCNVAGTLAAWGMNIVKADAFANAAGVVVDVFRFADQFRTLELNLQEWDRFQTAVTDVLAGHTQMESMIARRRMKPETRRVQIETKLQFDDESSPRSTLLEVVTQDRPGLLYKISSQLANRNLNIEAALIDTEGQMAIDVFYLTSGGKKLPDEEKQSLREALAEELSAD